MAEQKLMAFELNQLGYNFNTRNLDKLKFHIWGGAGLVWTANDRLTSVSFDSRVYRSGHASAVRLTKNGHAACELKVNGTYIRSFTLRWVPLFEERNSWQRELRTDSKLVTGAADGQDWSNKEKWRFLVLTCPISITEPSPSGIMTRKPMNSAVRSVSRQNQKLSRRWPERTTIAFWHVTRARVAIGPGRVDKPILSC